MREQRIRLDDVISLMREKLEAGQSVTFYPSGTSMLPFLREGRDAVTLSQAPKRLKKYDVPLYQRDNGQYVLHRVVRVGKTYTCIGDNQYVKETGITHAQIIAVCTAITRDGKTIDANGFSWRTSARLWHSVRFVRRVMHAIARRVGRHK